MAAYYVDWPQLVIQHTLVILYQILKVTTQSEPMCIPNKGLTAHTLVVLVNIK